MKHYSFYKNKKVLVTGGAGFIGSHITELLVNAGAQVTILDNLSTGTLDNIATIKTEIKFIEGDITNASICTDALANQEIVFHCAALVSVPEAEAYPELCFSNNIEGTFNLLEAARLNNVQRFIFSSSAAVYGPQASPCHESMACAPTSVYGYSKLIGELLCKQYSLRHGIKTVMLRYFNVYGDRQNAEHPYAGVVAKFKNAFKKNQPIILYGDGSQTRDFVPVLEIAHANLTLGSLPESYWSAEVYNIGTGISITLKELLAQLQQEYPDYNQDIITKEQRPGDIKTSSAECTKFLKIKEQSL